jgi:hypothetical protein
MLLRLPGHLWGGLHELLARKAPILIIRPDCQVKMVNQVLNSK